MDYKYLRNTTLEMKGGFRPAKIRSHIRLEINLIQEDSTWIADEFSATPKLKSRGPPSFQHGLAIVTLRQSISSDDIWDAIENALANCEPVLNDHERDQLIRLVWEKVRDIFTHTETLPYASAVLSLVCTVRVRNIHAYFMGESDDLDVIPTADSSFVLLNKSGDDSVGGGDDGVFSWRIDRDNECQ